VAKTGSWICIDGPGKTEADREQGWESAHAKGRAPETWKKHANGSKGAREPIAVTGRMPLRRSRVRPGCRTPLPTPPHTKPTSSHSRTPVERTRDQKRRLRGASGFCGCRYTSFTDSRSPGRRRELSMGAGSAGLTARQTENPPEQAGLHGTSQYEAARVPLT